MTAKWNINKNQSDVLIRTKDTTTTYLGGKANYFEGFVYVTENEIQDASISFSLDQNTLPSQIEEKKSVITFKSTSFQKIKNNINFLKGQLTIKDVTKIVELDAEFIGINEINGTKKAVFEINGNINKKDFGIQNNHNEFQEQFGFGKQIKLIASLEFSA